ncbi:MAG: hypothetical protein DMF89_01525 [Acidobacteria bacterium]|nr:MAG: hypothetical protein DMF89_01525 [Acidobacteriota bacterium]
MIRAVMIGCVMSLSAAPLLAGQDLKARGEKVYADQKCSVCHAIGGISGDDIRAWITDAKGMTEKTKAPRKPQMKSYNLPKEDVDALVAYLSALKKS